MLGALVVASAVATDARPLPRSHVVLPTATDVDPVAHTAVLPLHRGTAGGMTVWYVVTDSSDRVDAAKRGANYAPALARVGAACPSTCVATVTERDGGFVYPGAPTFSAGRTYVPSATGFPPKSAAPGAVASSAYTPFVRVADGAIVDAPIVATGDGPFDVTTHRNTAGRVLAIDASKSHVTLLTAEGFANGRRVEYISTEASDPGVATIERSTYVKGLAGASGIPIYAIANGTRQGLAFDALHGGLERPATLGASASLLSPDNILASFPTGATAAAYTPLWGANIGVFASAAHAATIVTSSAQIERLASAGVITSPGGKPLGPAGPVVNCPVLAYVDGAP